MWAPVRHATRYDLARLSLTAAQARFLLNTYYTNLYGSHIRHESVRSMRTKIIELEAHMDPLRATQPLLYRALARQCVDFERICMLIEKLS
ncbi:hypothetical protein [Xanthomonas phage RTH11]|nr:hypothetical protein [Xanthomonas phage RTH11]